MTGDDHANNGTAGRFDIYNSNSAPGCSVADWECVRGTSYIFPTTPISAAQVASFTAQGFEIGVHMWMSGLDAGSTSPSMTCNDYTATSIAADYSQQLSLFGSLFPAASPVRTNRTHCIVWSDYATQPQVALANGIRLDTNYYYWPGPWVNDVPGVFTGSGMPMRFAKADGTMIDVYQATTQMTDESDQTYPDTVNALLDRALGSEGYYGAFTANMHTDLADIPQSEAVVASALERSVPVISAQQLLTWVDGRNASAFSSVSFGGNTLSFGISVGVGANGLEAMIPSVRGTSSLVGLTRDGASIGYRVETIKGVSYAIFAAAAGAHQATYGTDATAPVITSLAATPGTSSAVVTWTTNEAATSDVQYGPAPDALISLATSGVTSTGHQVVLSPLNPGTTYYYRVLSTDIVGNTATAPAAPASFATGIPPSLGCPCTIWPSTQTPAVASEAENAALELGVKFRASADGFITGVRFYKGNLNTGVHIGNLWTASGSLP